MHSHGRRVDRKGLCPSLDDSCRNRFQSPVSLSPFLFQEIKKGEKKMKPEDENNQETILS